MNHSIRIDENQSKKAMLISITPSLSLNTSIQPTHSKSPSKYTNTLLPPSKTEHHKMNQNQREWVNTPLVAFQKYSQFPLPHKLWKMELQESIASLDKHN